MHSDDIIVVDDGWSTHSVSLGTDPALANYNTAIFLLSQASKNLTSSPRQTKSPDNFNILHMFNNTIYTKSRTACKHVLSFSYVFCVIWQNLNVTKLSIN